MKQQLDDKDFKILNILQKDSTMSVKEVGNLIGLSFTPTYERIKNLEKQQIIQKYVALVDRQKLGIGLIAYCNITMKEQSKKTLENFEAAIVKHHQILEVVSTSGTYDFMLKIYADDIDAYNDFIVNVISDIPNIGQYHSFIVLNEVKKSTAYIKQLPNSKKKG